VAGTGSLFRLRSEEGIMAKGNFSQGKDKKKAKANPKKDAKGVPAKPATSGKKK
jgi:hypothetical protein